MLGALGVAGCGDSEGSADSSAQRADPEEWTHSWCAVLRDFQNESLARGADLRQTLAGSITADQARREVVDYYADAVARIDRFIADLRRLGVPAVEDGPALVNSTERHYRTYREAVVRARDRATRLPSGPSAFDTENRRIASSVLVASDRLTRELGKWDDAHPTSPVQIAYREDPECKRLRAVK